MPASEFIKDVGEVDFEYEVILYSKSLPVLAYFWAEWCKPCRTIEPFLVSMTEHSMGSFRLARVDTDSNPNLAIRYEIRTLPTIKSFVDGVATGSLVGPQPENRILGFIQNMASPSQFILEIEKANGLLSQKQWLKAEAEFRKVLDEEPDNTSAMAGLIKSLLPQGAAGKTREALNLLDVFPASRDYPSVILLRPLVEELIFYNNDPKSNSDDLAPSYQNSLNLFRNGNLPASVDGLLDVLRASRNYRNGRVRQVILGILEIMGEDDPQTSDYRAELASILF
jgi:putative thioredoxin